MRKRKVYDRSFKENAVQLSLNRSDLSTLARELGVSSGFKRDFFNKFD